TPHKVILIRYQNALSIVKTFLFLLQFRHNSKVRGGVATGWMWETIRKGRTSGRGGTSYRFFKRDQGGDEVDVDEGRERGKILLAIPWDDEADRAEGGVGSMAAQGDRIFSLLNFFIQWRNLSRGRALRSRMISKDSSTS